MAVTLVTPGVKFTVGNRVFGGAAELKFQVAKLLVEVVDELQVGLDAQPRAGVGQLLGNFLTIGSVGELFRDLPSILTTANWTPINTPPIRFATELCEKTHANMLVGTCPWCGCVLFS